MRLKKIAIAALSVAVLSTSLFSINVSAAKELVRTNSVNRFNLGNNELGGTGVENGCNWIKVLQNGNDKRLFENVGPDVNAAALQVTFEISNWSGKEFDVTWGGNIDFIGDSTTTWCGRDAFKGFSEYKIDRNGEYTITCDLAKLCESKGKQGIAHLQTCEMVIVNVDYGDTTMIEVKKATIYLPGETVPEDKFPTGEIDNPQPSSDSSSNTSAPTDSKSSSGNTKPGSTKPAINVAKASTAKTTRSDTQVKKDKTAVTKAMKQAKIKKLTVKSKTKKTINVSWKKVKKAVGYQVQVSTKKNFKKTIYDKLTTKKKLTINSSKIKSGKKYYVRVRAYAAYKDKNNVPQKVYSVWNKKLRKVIVK